ncbi:TasA family protein [Halobaculum limi]|uniref:TasA family protein n=1 Tax=Halobaculum limi TaxID=3031916 RepID=UPI002404F517|nr:TasA family protein [Halobaculum sp. YSMS11]
MSDDDKNSGSTIELNRRRVLGALGTVGVASAGAGAGTFALFSDTETSSGNSVQAGTLDLTLGNGGSATLTASEVAPGDSGVSALQVNNDGNLDGSLDVNVSNVTPIDRNPEPEQSLDDTREFTIDYGFDNGSPQNQVSLQSEFGEVANVEIDLSSDPVVITADLPYALDPNGQFDDSITFAFDADNDGVEDFQLAARDYDDDDSLETVYDDASSLPSGSRNRNQSVPSGYDVRLENGNTRFVVEVPAGDLSDPFAVTGQANLAAYNPSTSGSNLDIPLIPGFGYNNPPVAGTSAFDGTATKMVEIQSGELRTLADMLDLTVTISSDSSQSSGDTFVASGKVNRLPMVDAEPNKPLPAGATNYVLVEYDLSPNVGNAVQKDAVEFDIEVDLNQEDSQ